MAGCRGIRATNPYEESLGVECGGGLVQLQLDVSTPSRGLSKIQSKETLSFYQGLQDKMGDGSGSKGRSRKTCAPARRRTATLTR